MCNNNIRNKNAAELTPLKSERSYTATTWPR